MEGDLDEGTHSDIQMIPDTNSDLCFQQLFLLFQHCWTITITLRKLREEKTFCQHVSAVLCRQTWVKKKKKMPLGWNWSYQTVDHLRNHSVIIWQVNSVVSCFLRSTAASSSTVKRWWTSTSTAWSSPCRPTRSTSSTAPRSRMRSKASSSGRPGGSGAAASRATVTNITTVFGVCITRRRVRGRRGTMASVCRKMSLPARRCTLRSTSLRCSRTASSSSHKCTVLPLHREDVTCNSAHCRLQSWVSCDRSDWLKPRRYSHPKTFSYRLKRFK